MGQERFRIRPPGEGADFDRWREEMFTQVGIAKLVEFINPLSKVHHFDHIGLSAACTCDWEEREFLSSVAAACAWWEHAEPVIDWDAVEAELVVATLSKRSAHA